ncbi:MAG: FmdE, Molybdenum formylmethanofuran dehydrogenase operon [Syntrophus sp. PtaU1.Bin208]|nr:MAG: FmdE, Molybdenum formylmethanofuran dehydrogenase operon [Syntrophus sp. PtaU1.Bin208]
MTTKIMSYSYDEYIELVRSFHGFPAPGILIGGFMVDLAVKNLPEGVLYDALCETQTCLPDAIQLLTPCTVGNGWLTVLPLGRYALSLYDKYTHEGVRVYLDEAKMEPWQEVRNWFMKLKTKKEQDAERLYKEIQEAGQGILSLRPVKLKPDFIQEKHKGKVALCPKCGESYPVSDGEICLGCQGSDPYL